MNFHNQEYAIRLSVEDEDTLLLLKHFSTLEEMNDFLKNALKRERFMGDTACIAPVEIFHGRLCCNSDMAEYTLMPVAELSLDQMQSVRRFLEKETDPERKRAHFADVAYVCPYCFREVDECRCLTYPHRLIHIDRSLVAIIRTLNTKGYVTRYCCGGHPEKDDMDIYISFEESYDFEGNLPEGAVYETGYSCVIRYRFDDWDTDEEERAVFQEECIKSLTIWADSLPDLYADTP